MTQNPTVELLEGNETIRRIMEESLRDYGIATATNDGEEAPEELASVLVADVDSGVEVAARVAQYLDDARTVLFCGLRGSREMYGDERWLSRPFTAAEFVRECTAALGFGGHDDQFEPPYNPRATAALKPPPADLSVAREEPVTREIGYDEAQDLERRLGLDPHTLSSEVEENAIFEELDIDDSAILSVGHLQFALGGRVAGEVASRRVDEAEINAQREAEIHVRTTRTPTFNQTMPDTPRALSDTTEEGIRRPLSGMTPALGLSPDSSGELSRPSPELAAAIRGVARMLAESWQRIALTSRTEDRADRIQRILAAAVGQGLRGAAEEVQRIPHSSGFSGSLNSLTFIEVIRTVRDRRLRGRIEVAIGDEAYVLHMNEHALDDIDTLSTSVDGLLIDILFQGDAIDEATHEELHTALAEGRFTGTAEMEVARLGLVDDARLQAARVVRAREIFRQLCRHRGGQFAFLDIRPGDGQPWPINPLRINVDQLMLELLRESSIDTGDSQATASTHLLFDPNRAALLEQEQITDAERNVLNFFRDGDTLEAARERLQSSGEDLDRIVDRLKKVELLRRSDPSIHVAEEAQRAINDELRGVRAIGDMTVFDLPTKEEEAEQTVAQTENWDLIPDTNELDEIISEEMAKFDTEDLDPGDDLP